MTYEMFIVNWVKEGPLQTYSFPYLQRFRINNGSNKGPIKNTLSLFPCTWRMIRSILENDAINQCFKLANCVNKKIIAL